MNKEVQPNASIETESGSKPQAPEPLQSRRSVLTNPPSVSNVIKPELRDQPPPKEGRQGVTNVLLEELSRIETQQRSPSARESIRRAIEQISAQQAKGIEKYGTSLQTWNGRDPLGDAMQEEIDRWQYLCQARLERADMVEQMNRLCADLMEVEEQRDAFKNKYDEVLKLLATVNKNDADIDTVAKLAELCKAAFKNSYDHGFWEENLALPEHKQTTCIPEKLMLMVSEISEALEEYRAKDAHAPIYFVEGKPEGIAVELADCVIRVFDLCGRFNWQLGRAIIEKMAYNATRPHKHGKVC